MTAQRAYHAIKPQQYVHIMTTMLMHMIVRGYYCAEIAI